MRKVHGKAREWDEIHKARKSDERGRASQRARPAPSRQAELEGRRRGRGCYNADMPSFYTRSGDDGTTGQLGEGRLPKYHPRIETLGTLDEVSAALGLARALCKAALNGPVLIEIQRDVYAVMAEVAATQENAERFRTIDQGRVQWLESKIDLITKDAPVPAEFILPGDSLAGAALALARTIARRAERRLAELMDKGEVQNIFLMQYLNRLSSLCFAMELLENKEAGHPTTLAKT